MLTHDQQSNVFCEGLPLLFQREHGIIARRRRGASFVLFMLVHGILL